MKKLRSYAFLLLFLLPFVTVNPVEADELIENSSVELNDYGHFYNVVIFVRFANETEYEAPYDYNHYERMFNAEGMVSLRDYYLEVSYGKLDIESVLTEDNGQIIYYTDIYDRGYYKPYSQGNPDGYEDDSEAADREHALFKRAVDYVDANNLIDSSINLDVNNDGDIDCLTFMVSGEDTGWNSLLWPHKWELYSYYDYGQGEYQSDAPTLNGSYVWYYTLELLGHSQDYETQVSVGILAHETFHLLSAPDLYHYYDYDWIEAAGKWDLMDSNEPTPAHMLGYMKHQYGNWITTVPEITESGSYTLYPLQDSENNLYYIDMGTSNEYIYFEYRDNEGFYESQLPDTGLLVYRVDEDYVNRGNEGGYYNTWGEAVEEVWVYRPLMDDQEPLIEFDSTDPGYDVDGDLSQAALSDANNYNGAGRDTSILLFASSGELYDLRISNVVEHEGYVTFDVLLQYLEINISGLDIYKDLVLLDLDNTYYSVSLDDTGMYDVYYTLDGTTPSTSSMLYQGEEIEITSENNHLQLHIYLDGEFVFSEERVYTFKDRFETVHDGYGNNQDQTWYLNFENYTEFDVDFSELSALELYDKVEISSFNIETHTFTSSQLGGESFHVFGEQFIVRLLTNSNSDDYYGFDADISIIKEFTSTGYYLKGDMEVFLEQGESYTDQGIKLDYRDGNIYTYQVDTDLDTETVGTYSYNYDIYDENDQFVETVTRTIHVGDYEKPVIELTGDTVYVEVNTTYEEPGYVVYDLGGVSTPVVVTGTVDTSTPGAYTLEYQVTDDVGNVSDIVTRRVVVRDTISPELTLLPSVDTVLVGTQWLDGSVTATDNYDTELDIKVSTLLDTETPGTYTVTYTVYDTAGNRTRISRKVTVVEPVIPIEAGIGCELSQRTFLSMEDVVVPMCFMDDTQMDYTGERFESYGNITIVTFEYTYTVGEESFPYETQVFVLAQLENVLTEAYIIPRKEEEL